MCRSMADIRSTAAEIRRGKKEDGRRKKDEGKKLQGKNIMAPYYLILTKYYKMADMDN